jgi:hypothetical protein
MAHLKETNCAEVGSTSANNEVAFDKWPQAVGLVAGPLAFIASQL